MTEILLINPKNSHNVGSSVRAAATLGADAVWYTGDRVDFIGHRGKERLPREERLREYSHVEWDNVNPLTIFDEARARHLTPVGIEITPGAESLVDFDHPEKALYVFGPEDGSLSKVQLMHCHKFVQIPSKGCVNLSAAVYLVLYDRLMKELRGEHLYATDRDMEGLDSLLADLERELGPSDPRMVEYYRKQFE